MRVRNLTAFLTPTLLLLGLAWLATPAFAAPQPRVEVCHIPPGNPDNYHTITISEKALSAHLAHGDLTGSCNSICASICDDGDACTVDDTGDCDQLGCPTARDPVDCSDGLNCTDDSCDSVDGCINDAVVCTPSDLCSVSECAEPEGKCMETPVVCGDGEVCDPASGDCRPTDTAVCGDGIIQAPEICDAGPVQSAGCDALSCRVKFGWDCAGEPSVCKFQECVGPRGAPPACGGDSDTIPANEDPCRCFTNTLPLVIGTISGIPDECLCGDFDGDGFHSVSDAAAIFDCFNGIRFDCDLIRDDVDGDGVLTSCDHVLVIRVSAFLDPAYTLTCPLRPEGTCGGDSGVSCDF